MNWPQAMERRRGPRPILAAIAILLSIPPISLRAQDCDAILNRMIRDLDDAVQEDAIDRALGAIGDLDLAYGGDAVASVERATRLPPVDGVGPAKSTTNILGSSWQTLAGKRATFSDIDTLTDAAVPGVDGLLKKAGEQAARANPGGVFEIQASAAIRRDPGRWGQLQAVLVDAGGPGTLNKIDTLTDTHAFQMKSRLDAGGLIGLGAEGVPIEDLQLLVAQSGGRRPVLVLSNPPSTELRSAASALGIEVVEELLLIR